MKIKEQDTHRLVIVPSLKERLVWVPYFPFLILFGFFPYLGPIVSVTVGLYILGKIVGTKVIIDKLAKTMTVEERRFLLLHRQRVILFSAVTGVGVGYDSYHEWGIAIYTSDKKVLVDLTAKEGDRHLASEISGFLGKELADRPTISLEGLKRKVKGLFGKRGGSKN